MTKAAPKAEVVAEAPSVVKIEDGSVDAAAINVIPEPKNVSTDVHGNKIEEL
jgi:hypothetical protein